MTLNWVLPLIVAFASGWVIWNRWIAQAVTMLFWGLFLFPLAATPFGLGGGVHALRFWLPFAGCFVLSILLTEAGGRLRRYQSFLRRRFPRYFVNPS